jgi:hypothetical protein
MSPPLLTQPGKQGDDPQMLPMLMIACNHVEKTWAEAHTNSRSEPWETLSWTNPFRGAGEARCGSRRDGLTDHRGKALT